MFFQSGNAYNESTNALLAGFMKLADFLGKRKR